MKRDIAKRLTWANGAGAGTLQEAVGDDVGHTSGIAVVLIHNPSAVTALAISCRVRWSDTSGTPRDAELASFTVAAGQTLATRVEGLGMGTPVIRATNNTVLGLTDGFDAELRVEFVGN
jgi:hypothetical protein